MYRVYCLNYIFNESEVNCKTLILLIEGGNSLNSQMSEYELLDIFKPTVYYCVIQSTIHAPQKKYHNN